MSHTIDRVTLRRDGKFIKEISLGEMNKDLYEQYREELYCPNIECMAKIEYASGDKRTFYRTKKSIVNGEEVIDQHIDGCMYSVEYNEKPLLRGRQDSTLIVGISERHLESSLNRAFSKYKDPNFGKNKDQKGDTSRSVRSASRPIVIDRNLPAKGKLSLQGERIEEGKRELPIYQKKPEDISEKDYGQIRTLSGIMTGIFFEENCIYITLKNLQGKKTRIYFGENFRVINPTQYEQLKYYKQYYERMTQAKKDVFVACVGEITKDDFEISVVISNYKAIKLNNLSHYQVYNELMS